MRTIHADLITAQKSGAADPYIYLYINPTDYSSRLIAFEWTEEPYRDRATIVLANSDRHFDASANNLLGKSFTIGTGYVTASGNKYCGDGAGSEANPTLWVKSQSMVSLEGEAVCILYAEGGWMKLREHRFIYTADPPYFNIEFTATQTIYKLIELALDEVSFSLNALGTQDDGIIDDYHPIFTANPLEFESPASLIYRLLQMTKCYLRGVESDGTHDCVYEIVYPQSTDSTNETYYSYTAPYFKEYVEKKNLLIPNSIAVFCNRDPDGKWDTRDYPLITGTAQDSSSIAACLAGGYGNALGEVWGYHIAPYITDPDNADKRAAAILARYKAETLAGRLLLPFHDCRVELYDRVSIIDKRGA